MRRISVVGLPGSGKSTLSRDLAARWGLTWIELDSLYHQAHWTPRDRTEFRADLGQRLAAAAPQGWVVDGNYSAVVPELVWPQADTVVWLDLPRRTVFPALLGRTLYRGALRVELWNGNTERLSQIFRLRPEDNLLLWAATNHPKYRRRYAESMMDPAWAHLRFLRLCSRTEVARLLDRGPP